jgi:hypothetical protein
VGLGAIPGVCDSLEVWFSHGKVYWVAFGLDRQTAGSQNHCGLGVYRVHDETLHVP